MHFERSDLAGLVLVTPERLSDERGYFTRTFCAEEFAREGLVRAFPQASLSYNATRGTVRGMHFQVAPHGETKLVRCARGAIYDVVVDLRQGEPTYRQWRGFELTAQNGLALYIPDGFAHGFQTLTDESEIAYAITPPFVPGAGSGVRHNDPAIAVRWPLPVGAIADKDRAWPLLADASRP
ncbi:dTDP-4-dehydrorhamnose 3,5-epimerase [uncultured Enterovirga sp.]|uniref:dTDP-4-dehydrorhamnose 3,5-epimerase n=1 Tax=uncultured Enterovirga sp. TaxID=2026352 RepID=UPI0035C9C6B5